MDTAASATSADKDSPRTGLGARRLLATVVVVAALGLLGAGVVIPLLVFTDWIIAAGVGAVASILVVFVASGLLTLAAVLWKAPAGHTNEGRVHGPRVRPLRKKSGLTSEATVRLLSALQPGAQQALRTTRVRSTGAPQYNTVYSSTPTRTYFVELGDPSGQLPDVYASLTKEGMHDIFEVPSRQRAREAYVALASVAGEVAEPVREPFADVTLVCGERESALVDPSVPLVKLEHPDLGEEWWATPGLFDLFTGVPTVRLVDLLNEYAQPGVGARVNEGWAAAWVASSEPRHRRVEQLGHALMHLTSLPEDYEFLYGRSSEGKANDPVLRTLRSNTIARAAATRRDALGIVSIVVTGLLAVLVSRGAGPDHWVGNFWAAAAIQAGALIVAGIVVLVLRPDHATRQRGAGKQLVALADQCGWQLRRDVPRVGDAFPWLPFAAVVDLNASPIVQPAPENSERASTGAAFLYGDLGRWPNRRPFAARAVWVSLDAEFARTDIIDRTVPDRVTRMAPGEPFSIEHTDMAQRWHLRSGDPQASRLVVAGRAAALLEELPPGEMAIQVVGGTVMVWDTAVEQNVDLEQRLQWVTRFAHALAR